MQATVESSAEEKHDSAHAETAADAGRQEEHNLWHRLHGIFQDMWYPCNARFEIK